MLVTTPTGIVGIPAANEDASNPSDYFRDRQQYGLNRKSSIDAHKIFLLPKLSAKTTFLMS